MQRTLLHPVAQLSPGMHPAQPLVENFVKEEMNMFMSSKTRVKQAIVQGRAHLLLLQSQGAS